MSIARAKPAAKNLAEVGRRWMSTAKTGWWRNVPVAPRDPILGVTEAFLKDPDPSKVNVGVGAYRDDNGKPVVLECVRRAEKEICGKGHMEYLPMSGSAKFNELALKLAYGEDSEYVTSKSAAAIQTISGTGACRMMAEYHRKFENKIIMFLPEPTWSNHHSIWKDTQLKVQKYQYYDPVTKGLNFAGLMDDVKKAPDCSFWLFHACAHNPTGVDPTPEQWKELSKLMKEKNHFPFFDMAYQGFASGDCEKDAQAVRIFIADGHQVALAQSFAKNMGLYGQRVGCLSILTDNEKQAISVRSQLQQTLRPIYSTPPLHGAEIVSTILGDRELKALWLKEVKGMADRIISMRVALRENIEKLGSKHNWQHITDQIGMFCYSGITPEQVEKMIEDHHVYLTSNGRISIAGINSGNVEYIANALHEVTK